MQGLLQPSRLVVMAALSVPALAFASTAGSDPLPSTIFALAIILIFAKLGAELAMLVKQPAVLGELLAGLVLGSFDLMGIDAFHSMEHDAFIELLANLGVLMLLFEVGLESTVGQMMKVGITATVVAVVGVIGPFALGWVVGVWLMPEASTYVHAFIGATLSATSVGITARVLKDLNHGATQEARIILGAAVIDDVLGLVILSLVTGIIAAADKGQSVSVASLAIISGKALGFLVLAIVLGQRVSPLLFRLTSRLRGQGLLLSISLGFCFFMAWLAVKVELAAIVGAFAAGLLLERVHYQDLATREKKELEDLIHPITGFLAPVFFVMMGMRTDLSKFVDLHVLGIALALTVAAILGKQLCSLAVGRGIDRLTIGLGMIPRGEVGLIFAAIGGKLMLHGEPVISQELFSAIVFMVMATTFVTPPALSWSIRRRRDKV